MDMSRPWMITKWSQPKKLDAGHTRFDVSPAGFQSWFGLQSFFPVFIPSLWDKNVYSVIL